MPGTTGILQVLGKVDADNALVVVSQAVSGTPGPTNGAPIANLPGKTDASNALVVTFG